MKNKIFLGLLLIIPLFYSCKESKEDLIFRLVNEWKDKTLIFPSNLSFVSYVKKTKEYEVYNSKYIITTYVDSIGCMSCKLQLEKWKELIQTYDSIHNKKISFLFYFHPRYKKELIDLLKKNKFDYPICIDENDSFNKLNNFPSDMTFQTFLLDQNHKVLAIGNPIHNPKVEKLYSRIIADENLRAISDKMLQTNVRCEPLHKYLGTFDWKQERIVEFILTNTGTELLVIEGISASCGCTTVDYSKEPTQPGKNLILKVKYKAEHPEHFNKTLTVYCNASGSPFQLKISGNAQ